jgi:SAM-dependent methyltransferase
MKVTPQRIVRAAGNRAEVAFRFLLRLFLPFDPWHRMPLAAKDYAVGIIAHLNSLPRNHRGRVADIGCGLGDILLNLHFEDRLGLDNDPAVLKGAEIVRLTHFRGNARFAAYSFPGEGLDGLFDAVIMVGWLHGIQPGPSKAGITRIYRDHVSPGGCLIIDTVSKDGYPFRHEADFLLGDLGGVVDQISAYPCGRRVWKVTKDGAGVRSVMR